jgi:transposase-like protein
MDAKFEFPKTLVEATTVFANLNYATAFFSYLRWPNGVCCPHCGSEKVDYLPHRRLWQCRTDHPKNQFSVKIGTVFEECRLPIDKCLLAIWLEVNAKNSISSCEIARHLGCTQKTGWFLLHRVRFALKQGSLEKLGRNGVPVEADESYIGGRAVNMHKDKRAKLTGTGGFDKAVVMGLLERHSAKRHSTVRTEVLEKQPKQADIRAVIHKHVEPGAHLITDEHPAYKPLYTDYEHQFINHVNSYAEGIVHTNGLENFWALFKRCIKGTHVSVEPFHLAAYLDSEAFRFNNRKTNDAGRFAAAAPTVVGKRLTYKALTGALEGFMASGNTEGNDRPA